MDVRTAVSDTYSVRLSVTDSHCVTQSVSESGWCWNNFEVSRVQWVLAHPAGLYSLSCDTSLDQV